jgi:PAS domain S-box-containing protein
MPGVPTLTGSEDALDRRVRELAGEQQELIYQRTDRLFVGLMLFQWLAGILAALWISPQAWAGSESRVHLHVWAAVYLGGVVTALPVFLALIQPGSALTRHAIAIGQMLTSALLIDLTGGRIETHFHVFGSLAFLAFYRDWRILVSATLVVAIDHFIRGVYWPQSVYGVLTASPWRWLEHAGWVVFENIFLIAFCLQGVRDLRQMAERQARLELMNETIEATVQDLEASETRKAAIVASALDAIVTIDHTGKILEFNPAAEKTFGYPRAAAIGKDVEELILPPSIRARYREGLTRHVATGKGLILGKRIEIPAMRSDGSEFPIELSISQISLSGRPTFTGYLRDITQRKLAEEALRASETLYRTLGEAVPDFVWACDRNGEPVYVNPRWTEYTGLSVDSPGTISMDVLHHPDDYPRLVETWQAAAAHGTPYETEFRLRRHDGSYRWFMSRAVPMKDEDGRVIHWIGTSTDIHQRKQAEDALRASLEELARADRAKDHFLAVLAHELRNPLGAISNAIQLLKRRENGDLRLAGPREIIERQLQHQVHMLDDLLNVSRIARGKIMLHPVDLDLGRLVHDVAEDHRHELEAAHLTLSVGMPEHPVWLQGDPTRLAQVFGNLLTNAAKFTDPGGAVSVELRTVGDRAVASVRDTGIGIEPELLPRIFESFTQAERSLHRSRGGLGLGLALVRGLVELHGGSVEVESEGLGRGTEFRVLLPLTAHAPASEPEGAPLSGPMRSLRILLVEDNEDAAVTLGELLELAGCRVAMAHDGIAALELVDEFQPEVVLCDLGLPGMDGYQVARELRRRQVTANARLIAVSGYSMEEDQRRACEAGFDLHLTKPLDFSELGRLLEAVPENGRV